MPKFQPFHATYPCPDSARGGAYGWRFNVRANGGDLVVAGDETFATRELAHAAGARAVSSYAAGAEGREP